MPPLPLENNPGGVGEGRDQGAATRTGESGVAVLIPGVSMADPGAQYADYVPHIVLRGTRSSSKRALLDSSSPSASAQRSFVHRACQFQVACS
jgi:hypothetical protein